MTRGGKPGSRVSPMPVSRSALDLSAWEMTPGRWQ